MKEIKTEFLASARELDIIKTFECGQCFRWNADENGVYRGLAGSSPAELWTEDGKVYVKSGEDMSFWRHYFDLDTDYEAATAQFRGGEYLDRAIEYGRGIRILNQDPWEATCSFIISQCNNIKRIKGIVEKLCTLCGDEIEFDGSTTHGFPAAEKLAVMKPEDLAPLRSGYRAPYIVDAAAELAAGKLDLEALKKLDYAAAKKRLTAMNGVGEKVANCIILFGLHKMEAFPIDVWIKRALKEHFPADFDPATLGPYAGLAQQYIFYYARENG